MTALQFMCGISVQRKIEESVFVLLRAVFVICLTSDHNTVVAAKRKGRDKKGDAVFFAQLGKRFSQMAVCGDTARHDELL